MHKSLFHPSKLFLTPHTNYARYKAVSFPTSKKTSHCMYADKLLALKVSALQHFWLPFPFLLRVMQSSMRELHKWFWRFSTFLHWKENVENVMKAKHTCMCFQLVARFSESSFCSGQLFQCPTPGHRCIRSPRRAYDVVMRFCICFCARLLLKWNELGDIFNFIWKNFAASIWFWRINFRRGSQPLLGLAGRGRGWTI